MQPVCHWICHLEENAYIKNDMVKSIKKCIYLQCIFCQSKKNNDGEIRRIFFLQYCVLFRRMIEKENFFVDHSISDEKKQFYQQ